MRQWHQTFIVCKWLSFLLLLLYLERKKEKQNNKKKGYKLLVGVYIKC